MSSSRWQVVLAAVALMLTGVSFDGRGVDGIAAGQSDQLLRKIQSCGTNSLYLYLRLHGRNVRFGALADRLVVSSEGVTMAQLASVAGENGLGSHVVKVTSQQLCSLPVPLIAHYNWRSPSNRSGHYVVVTGISPSSVHCIDGTTGKATEIPRATFEYFWSGHVVTPNAPAPIVALLVVIGIDALVIGSWIRNRFR